VHELAAAFLDARSETLSDHAVLESRLAALLAEATAAWPTVVSDPSAWIRALAPHAPQPCDVARPFGALLHADHYVAFAASRGDATAIAACDALLVREAGFAADGARLHPSVRDEAIQVSRELLFAPRGERPPAIAGYTGRGALRAWLRVSISRELVRLAKAQSRSAPLEEHIMSAASFHEDPVLEELKTKYRAELATAFRTALAELPARERTLLRYQVIDGLTVDEVGSIYKVHRATAARWLAKIRDDLVDRTRGLMAEALGVDTAEAASIVRLVQSQLDVSVIRHLGE
jgi:RNA polymerase sigma-70 factor, ECF subfamily